jgi:hypothetical protein
MIFQYLSKNHFSLNRQTINPTIFVGNLKSRPMKSFLTFLLLCTVSLSFAQVGIGTTDPQAQLEVANGNVRFSSYGNGTYSSATPTFLLGVDTNGDIVETNLIDRSGLQYYTWNIANTSQPNIGSV